ncbi:hypothetical protein S40288_02567 [Stachybotrys chartarum IBT 40288]|nr:hypothetical protein S40288_02567 [Stachybotrys chartarum IBT 40288]
MQKRGWPWRYGRNILGPLPPVAGLSGTNEPRFPPPELVSFADYFKMGGGGKVPYPKHVWSPAGGWYAQPANWRGNTIIAGGVMFAIVLCTWKFSAERETWAHNPEPGSWYPSRRWSKQLVQFDKEQRLKSEGKE